LDVLALDFVLLPDFDFEADIWSGFEPVASTAVYVTPFYQTSELCPFESDTGSSFFEVSLTACGLDWVKSTKSLVCALVDL